jgi:hypothetical protein
LLSHPPANIPGQAAFGRLSGFVVAAFMGPAGLGFSGVSLRSFK